MKEHKEDYRVLVRIFTDKSNIEDVLCKVFLPKRVTEQIELYFYPNEKQRLELENIDEFSIYGERRGFSGKIEAKIEAKKVYCKSRSNKHWGPDIAECIFTAEPNDLKVTKFFHRNSNTFPQKTIGSFWLTPCNMLSPQKNIERSDDGNVKVETIRQFSFTLVNGFSFVFDDCFHYLKSEDGDHITFTELVAKFEMNKKRKMLKVSEIIGCFDDFLMIVSFSP